MLEHILDFLRSLFFDPHAQHPADLPMNQESEQKPVPPPMIAVDTPKPVVPTYPFDTYANSRHSTRVICDEEGVTDKKMYVSGKLYSMKEVMCACIEVESHFENYIKFNIANGPTIHENYVGANLSSTDYGICQINDYWHIGAQKDFPSVSYVLNNPENVVRWMAKMVHAGNIDWWVSFTGGAYKKYLP